MGGMGGRGEGRWRRWRGKGEGALLPLVRVDRKKSYKSLFLVIYNCKE
jgi:hypothetical protein